MSLANLEISNFYTKNVKSMRNMFCGCTSLTYLDISNFKSNDDNDINSMFLKINKECHILCNDEKILSEFKKAINN